MLSAVQLCACNFKC